MKNINSFVKSNTDTVFKPRDPVSAATHFTGFILAILGTPAILIRAAENDASLPVLIGFAAYMFTMILLYGASTSYHSFNCITDRGNRILKKIDHISIFLLIAGSYTPVCLTVLNSRKGIILLVVIWSIAFAGTLFKAIWVYCPKWVSSLIYIGMGWAALSVLGDLYMQLSGKAFFWLIAGGVCYTIGGVIYALKPQIFHNEWFGNHELFHCFVLAGSLSHYVMMFGYLALIG